MTTKHTGGIPVNEYTEVLGAEIDTLKTFVHHRVCVAAALQKVVHEFERRQMLHDESKFHLDEFAGFARINATARRHPYGSEEYMAALEAEKPALDRHFARNPHHPEHHDDPTKMGLFDLIEMVCDWYGAHRVYESAKPAEKRRSWAENMEVQRRRFARQFSEGQWFVVEQVASFLEEAERETQR